MDCWINNYVLAFVLSVLLTGLIIPKIILISFRKKLFDSQDMRKIHRGVVPRLGGIAFLPSICFSICLVFGLDLDGGYSHARMLLSGVRPSMFMVCAAMMMYLVGIADDLIGVRYRAKFIFQAVAAGLIMLSGLWVKNLYGFIWVDEVPSVVGCFLTLFVVVYVVNAINLIDGIDGLASGLSCIALMFYSYVFFVAEEYIYAVISAATIGTLVPFFYYNVFGDVNRQSKIFMGDTGSLTIGVILVFLSLEILDIGELPVETDMNMFVMAVSPVLLPCFDVVRVFFRRIRKGRNPFLADRSHIHHKLLALGMKQWQALTLILFADAVIVGVNMALSMKVQPTWLILGDIVIWSALNMLLTEKIHKREERLGHKLYE